MRITVETVAKMLTLHYGSAFAVAGLLNDTKDPDSYRSVDEAQTFSAKELPHWHKVLIACNEVMKGHGVENLGNVAYVNMGDTSYMTVLYDKKREMLLVESLNQWAALYG